MGQKKVHTRFALCIRSDGNDDLLARKFYAVLADPSGEAKGFLRVVDESVEDYLYPNILFMFVELAGETERALASSA